MPIKTIAAVAAASAAAGAAVTSLYFASQRREETRPTPTSSTAPSSVQPPVPATAAHAMMLQPPVDPNGVFKYGFPGPISDLRRAPALTSAYDRRTHNPHWVAEHITPESLAMNRGDRRHSSFVEDDSIPQPFRARLKDYARSGYDRGHQVPAADAKWSQDAMDATFALSNMCPQVGDGFNRDYWAHLEDFVRRLTHAYPSVRCVTGPLYLPARDAASGKWRVSYEVIGDPPGVAVPTHFFKVVFAEDKAVAPGGSVALAAFVLPNAPIDNDRPLKDFEVPLDVVERAAGLEFAQKLPVARRRALCKEVDCSVMVKEYRERQSTFAKMQQPPSPPSPLSTSQSPGRGYGL